MVTATCCWSCKVLRNSSAMATAPLLRKHTPSKNPKVRLNVLCIARLLAKSPYFKTFRENTP
jgi:hypothetical protein